MSRKKLARGIGVCGIAIMIMVVVTILPSCESSPTPPTYGLEFDGEDDYVNLGEDISLKPSSSLTVAAWINLQTPTTSREPVVVGNARYTATQVSGYQLSTIPTGTWEGSYWNGNWNNITSYDIALLLHRGVAHGESDWRGSVSIRVSPAELENQWHHIVAVFNKPTMKIFVDGAEETTAQYNYDINYDVTTMTYIGVNNWKKTSQGFSGIISEVHIYNRALSTGEINDIYRYHDVTDGLVGYWKLDEDSGTTVHDNTVNNNTGTLEGDPVWFTGGG
jgi:hypothetical protein